MSRMALILILGMLRFYAGSGSAAERRRVPIVRAPRREDRGQCIVEKENDTGTCLQARQILNCH
jgi:hypothetical protein